MPSVQEHYSTHLGPLYAWMAGGADAAMARGAAEIAALLPDLATGALAVDLGAGFGMHAIALARRGCAVLALDTSSLLLQQLTEHAAGLPVTAVEEDLSSFPRHLDRAADAILCMGDTLTHLSDPSAVETLFGLAARSLRPGGKFIATFRDYTAPLQGAGRFIPVKSDADRILTCFLEYGPDSVDVHDIVHERVGNAWDMRVSVYRKLRLSPRWVCSELRAAGFSVTTEPGLAGMVRVVATTA
ncbi:MAG: class I SAM-dependent methyltransferase [Pseudomonadota bacterium]|nr:class I SAM-dependent methyltransferase [Pseudomonadota bacterium]